MSVPKKSREKDIFGILGKGYWYSAPELLFV